jgi:hypothetical protein
MMRAGIALKGKEDAMKPVIATAVVLVAIATAGHANTYTYMCRVGHKSYPVQVTTSNEANGSMSGGTITWRGTVFQNVKLGDGCRYNFVGTCDGVTAELCTATKGVADLRIGEASFECQLAR